MTTETLPQPKEQVDYGKKALRELKTLVQSREDRLVINGRQYLYFNDWQILGAFFGITARVIETSEITKEVPSKEQNGLSFKETIGFLARASAVKDGTEVSAAEAECMFDEPNWKSKPRFQLRSMAQTRACAKALRNCLSWVVRLPNEKPGMELAPEASAEEMQGSF